ncbi:hypothetical protein Vadar_027057 [Vaccinium darrowii]|uniref:Uncharacterized protein n=1 Tax=Vaccinium darrowii TaxID=229202 RepID=A0ACB7XTX8_9ERIC|nr:hypothetical protein Vadar_027057 [Vaccinium darrowii]
MGTVLPENLCAHRKGAIEELIKGRARDTAAQLQTLFGKPTGDHDGLEELLLKHLTSFTESLSHVSPSSCEDCECEVTQIPNRVGSPIDDQRSMNSGESCKSPAAEDWRGCYKRRCVMIACCNTPYYRCLNNPASDYITAISC